MTKEQFEQKLLKRRIKTRFMKNLKQLDQNTHDFWAKPRTIDQLLAKAFEIHQEINWRNILLVAFYWQNSPENHMYWEEISMKAPD